MAFKEQEKAFDIIGKIYDGETSEIYRLRDGRLFKKAKPLLINMCYRTGVNYEAKLLSTSALSVKEIVSPISVSYDGKFCTGFTMEEVFGPSLNTYDDDFTIEQRSDLDGYYELYSKIEDVVRRASKVGVVMPDLCTCDNIIIQKNGLLRFFDFDGMQFGRNDRSIAFSTSLKHIREYLCSRKFVDGQFHFTKELDITSLTILMFLVVFNIDLNRVGTINPFTGKVITIEEIFDLLGLKDDVFMRKVSANLSLTERGSFIADDLRRVASNYRMEAVIIPEGLPNSGMCLKKLIKK